MSEIVSYDSMTVSIEDITCLGRGIGSWWFWLRSIAGAEWRSPYGRL